ncbi:MAG: hypothetical protein ACKO16_01245 [Gemmataceae bacterium]
MRELAHRQAQGPGERKGSELVELSENICVSWPFDRLRDRELALRQAQGP